MNEVGLHAFDHGRSQLLDDSERSLLQTLGMTGLTAHAGDSDRRPIPELMIGHFRSRHPEPPNPVDRAPQHLALVFQRLRAIDTQMNLGKGDDHDTILTASSRRPDSSQMQRSS